VTHQASSPDPLKQNTPTSPIDYLCDDHSLLTGTISSSAIPEIPPYNAIVNKD
jgi:hypothetical protein